MDILVEKRDDLMAYLKTNGIGTRVMYPPINQQKAYLYPGSYPVSETVGKKGLWLPSFPGLRDEQIDFISEKIKEFYQKG